METIVPPEVLSKSSTRIAKPSSFFILTDFECVLYNFAFFIGNDAYLLQI
jgi:hypothetical protein